MKSFRVKRNKNDEELSSSLPNLSLDLPRKTPVAPPRRDLVNDSQTFYSSESERLLVEGDDESPSKSNSIKNVTHFTASPSKVNRVNKEITREHKESKETKNNSHSNKDSIEDIRSRSASLKREKNKFPPKDVIRIGSQMCRTVFDKYDTFLFDMDGVLWQGNKIISNSIQTVQFLRDNGKNVYFITNNSTKSRSSYVKKLKKLGLDIDRNHCFGSASMTALFLQHCKQFDCETDRVYVIGEHGILSELEDVGINYVYDHVLPVPEDLNDIIIKPDPTIKVT
eukprot:NODE_769_length_4386_cov_0.176155.p1 type:complete len:282 gc:universal NODE_769_length_4386_cov_0.176155:2787-1942(-)